jgi:hypothetical protein
MRSRCGLVLALLCFAAAVAQAAPQCNESIGPGYATFCDGYYALCIKARCKPAAHGSNEAECACAVEQGWSMGPAPCSAPGRKLTTPPPANALLMSTYSNLFNTSEKTLTCAAPDTQWAWCYGADCTVDAKDPSKAVCRCPVCTGAASTLGGNCKHVDCKEIWSAATPKNDAFANTHYYKYLTRQGVQVPPPATACRQ